MFNTFMIIEDALWKRCLKESSQRYCIALAGMLFILLKALKSCSSWQRCSTKYKIPSITFQRLKWSTLQTVDDDYHDHAAVTFEELTRMKF